MPMIFAADSVRTQNWEDEEREKGRDLSAHLEYEN